MLLLHNACLFVNKMCPMDASNLRFLTPKNLKVYKINLYLLMMSKTCMMLQLKLFHYLHLHL